MTKAGKIWGETRPVLVTHDVEIHELTIFPNSWCSRHRHRSKHNWFYCVRGRVTIETETTPGLTDKTLLEPGEVATVAPGVTHRFVTNGDGATVLEAYYRAGLSADDIERDDTGGRGVLGKFGEMLQAMSGQEAQHEHG